MSARTSPDCARGTLNGRDGRPGPRTGEVRTAPVQAAALADRAAAHAPLDNPRGVAVLLDSLREAGAEQQAAALAERLPGAGMFELCASKEASRIGSGSGGRLTAAQPGHGAGKIWTDAAGLSNT